MLKEEEASIARCKETKKKLSFCGRHGRNWTANAKDGEDCKIKEATQSSKGAEQIDER